MLYAATAVVTEICTYRECQVCLRLPPHLLELMPQRSVERIKNIPTTTRITTHHHLCPEPVEFISLLWFLDSHKTVDKASTS
eukprot:COSAG06_NODE_3410_length_5383_cov_180.550530_6_plen_82_part_00